MAKSTLTFQLLEQKYTKVVKNAHKICNKDAQEQEGQRIKAQKSSYMREEATSFVTLLILLCSVNANSKRYSFCSLFHTLSWF